MKLSGAQITLVREALARMERQKHEERHANSWGVEDRAIRDLVERVIEIIHDH